MSILAMASVYSGHSAISADLAIIGAKPRPAFIRPPDLYFCPEPSRDPLGGLIRSFAHAAIMAGMLLGCTSNDGGGSYCLTARPIYVAAEDVLTAETARAILAANETGARLCGWQGSAAKDERR